MEERDMYLFLSSIYRITQKDIDSLKKEFKKLENLMYLDKDKILKNKKINSKLLRNIVKYRGHSRIEKIKRVLKQKEIQYVCIEDKNYPQRLKHIDIPPPILFYKGDISFLQEENVLAVIGSRTPTNYGIQCVRKFTEELSDIGMHIVSGLALGIDCEAHIACMKGRYGKTAAVIGSPLDNIRPATNMKIADKILENGGAIISEFFLGTTVNKLNFIMRNRIISGLSKGVLVIEAAQKSGALGTANYAEDQGRDVFAVPGRINDSKSEGCLDLLSKGAYVARTIEDIAEHYEYSDPIKKFCTLNNCEDSIEYDIKSLNYEKQEILNSIKQNGNIKIDDICNCTGIDIKTINSNINELLIDDYIIEMENKTYGFNV